MWFYFDHRTAVSILLFALILMNSARYFFNFGSSSSSPGYSDTPLVFWAFRYALVGLVLFLFVTKWKRFRLSEWTGFFVLLSSSAYALSVTNSTLIQIAAFHACLSALMFVSVRTAGDNESSSYIGKFTTLLYGLSLFFAAFLFLQVFLYLVFDVVPSHSHRGTIIVRFGSVLDDSLAFGVLLPMFAGFLYYGIRDEFFRTIAVLMVVLASVLSGSLTAMATTCLYTIWIYKSEWRKLLGWISLLSLLLLAFHWYFFELWLAKAGSIAGHLEGLDVLAGDLGARDRSGGVAESGWILLLKNLGLPAFAVVMCFQIYISILCFRLLRSKAESSPFVAAVEGLNFSAFVASFNLPVLMIFPLYLLISIFGAVLVGLYWETYYKEMRS